MKKFLVALVILISIIMIGYTQNQRAKTFGGTTTVDLPCNMKRWKNYVQILLFYNTRIC
jgi:hypothetical protein